MFRRGTWTSLIATLFISSGVLLLFLRTWIFDSLISSVYLLGPKSPILDSWLIPPIQVNVDFYFFNWTNPEDIYNLTSKPKFEEIGPYRFRCEVEKVNVTWNPNNTVTFRLLQTYFFDEENSLGRFSDQITTINTVALSAAHHIRNEGYFSKKGFSLSLLALAPQIHVTKSAGELLFEGYHDPYIDLVVTLPFLSDKASPVDKAGFLYGRNGSYKTEGVFNVATGEDKNLGEILRWNYQNASVQYQGSCSQLKGSIGDLFPQRQSKDAVRFFLANACRNLILDYEEDVIVRGINAYKYSAGHSMLDNGTFSPENKCLCNGECVPSGTMNISSCAFGAPAFLSLPHFYGADPVYLSNIEGLRPDKSKHEMYLTVEPRIGTNVGIALRLQSNFLLQPIEHITLYEGVPKMFFPVLWSEQKVSIPEEFAWMLRLLLCLPSLILPALAAILIIIGLLILFFTKFKLRKKFIGFKEPKKELNHLEKLPLQTLTNGNTSCIQQNKELLCEQPIISK